MTGRPRPPRKPALVGSTAMRSLPGAMERRARMTAAVVAIVATTAHGMKMLLADLATLTLDEVTLPASPDHAFTMVVEPPRNVPMQRAG